MECIPIVAEWRFTELEAETRLGDVGMCNSILAGKIYKIINKFINETLNRLNKLSIIKVICTMWLALNTIL